MYHLCIIYYQIIIKDLIYLVLELIYLEHITLNAVWGSKTT